MFRSKLLFIGGVGAVSEVFKLQFQDIKLNSDGPPNLFPICLWYCQLQRGQEPNTLSLKFRHFFSRPDSLSWSKCLIFSGSKAFSLATFCFSFSFKFKIIQSRLAFWWLSSECYIWQNGEPGARSDRRTRLQLSELIRQKLVRAPSQTQGRLH